LVEQVVDFVLGFVICGLIGLAFLPLVSARARRLTLARIESRLPMTFDEIEAERDLLRARFAVENRALEVKVAEKRDGRAEEVAELGRRAVAIMRLTEQLEKTTAQLNERNAELAKTLDLAEKTRAEWTGDKDKLTRTQAILAQTQKDLAKVQSDFDQLRAIEAGLAAKDAELTEARARLEQAEAERNAISTRADELSGQTRTLASDLAEAERRHADFDARSARMLAKIAAERKHVDDLEGANLDLRRQIVVLAGAVGGGAKSGGDILNGAPRPDHELLDLREAIFRLGRQIAHLDDAAR
jgi:chromosome segregation ATPase